jgi:putative flippase GtrA
MEDKRKSEPDFFDRLMTKGFLKKFEAFYKSKKEILLYLFFGGCTTLVGIIFYAIPVKLISLPDLMLFNARIDMTVQVSNVISWICAVTFAYITNRTWVFEDKAYGARGVAAECFAFFAGRFVTLIIENILLNLSTTALGMGEIIAKIVVSVVTIILNYIISKLFVFKGNKGEN